MPLCHSQHFLGLSICIFVRWKEKDQLSCPAWACSKKYKVEKLFKNLHCFGNFLENISSGKIHQIKNVGKECGWLVGSASKQWRLVKTEIRDPKMSTGSHVPSPRCGKAEKFPFLFYEPKPHLGGKHVMPSSASLVQVRPLCLQKGVFLCPFQCHGGTIQPWTWRRWYSSPQRWLQFTGNLWFEISIIVLDGLAKDVQPKVCLAPGTGGTAQLQQLLAELETGSGHEGPAWNLNSVYLR